MLCVFARGIFFPISKPNGMTNRMISIKIFAPRRQVGNEKVFLSGNLACFASLQLAPWNSTLGEQFNLGQVGIPQGESSFPGFRNSKFNGKFQIFLVETY
jgi:hypothetical protein